MKYKIQGIIVPKRLPPIHPSQVFLGEIFGHILFLPKNFPEKRANESVITGIETKYKNNFKSKFLTNIKLLKPSPIKRSNPIK